MNNWREIFPFRPKLIESLRGYTRARLGADMLAGMTVGIVALPLAIGFGIASGVSPGAGLYTAVIGGFLVAVLGGSRVQIGGPAGAFVGLIYAIVSQHGLNDLLVCTAMAGVFLFILGVARLGTLIKFIPRPVTTGFTCGIAITIILTQVKDFFGLPVEAVPAEFFAKMTSLGGGMTGLSMPTLGVGLLAVVIILAWPRRWSQFLPGSMAAVVVGTLVVWGLGLSVETIGSRFGVAALPRGLPEFGLPTFDLHHLGELIRPAMAIALLGSIESLLSAVVADGMIDDRHDSNQELMGQGIANFVVPFFGGMPVTGAIARTATNVRTGATSPVAGVVHAATLLLIILAAAPLVGYIPLSVLGAVLIVVAVRMGEWEEFLQLARQPKSDASVFLVTFGLTVVFDLTVAVEIGMLMAAVLFIRRVVETTHVSLHDGVSAGGGEFGGEKIGKLPPGVLVYRIFGSFLFGAAEKLENAMRRARVDARVVIVHLAAVNAMDATALNALESLHTKLHRHGKHLVLCGPHTQPYFLMEKAGFLEKVGHGNIAADMPAAIARAASLVEKTKG